MHPSFWPEKKVHNLIECLLILPKMHPQVLKSFLGKKVTSICCRAWEKWYTISAEKLPLYEMHPEFWKSFLGQKRRVLHQGDGGRSCFLLAGKMGGTSRDIAFLTFSLSKSTCWISYSLSEWIDLVFKPHARAVSESGLSELWCHGCSHHYHCCGPAEGLICLFQVSSNITNLWRQWTCSLTHACGFDADKRPYFVLSKWTCWL